MKLYTELMKRTTVMIFNVCNELVEHFRGLFKVFQKETGV